ncbi:MAG TPA: hypothetical protein ENK43_04345 [Planctomycetes bacterium]|nr:hypothetical protein [Planctomycetota bacterium]
MPELTPQEIVQEEKTARAMNLMSEIVAIFHDMRDLSRRLSFLEDELGALVEAEKLSPTAKLPNHYEAQEQEPMPTVREVRGALNFLAARLHFSKMAQGGMRATYRKLTRRSRGGI